MRITDNDLLHARFFAVNDEVVTSTETSSEKVRHARCKLTAVVYTCCKRLANQIFVKRICLPQELSPSGSSPRQYNTMTLSRFDVSSHFSRNDDGRIRGGSATRFIRDLLRHRLSKIKHNNSLRNLIVFV